MKNLLTILAIATTLLFASCEKEHVNEIKLYDVAVKLNYPADSGMEPTEGVTVSMKSSAGTITSATSDMEGVALFSLPDGIYEISVSEQRSMNGYTYTFNGTATNVVISATTYTEGMTIDLEMVGSSAGQIIIKEIYAGGCQKDDGSGAYQMDKYMVIYNNSAQEASISNFCIGMVGPYNAHAGTNNYVDDKLVYGDAGYTPTMQAFWFMQNDLVMQPYESKVIALHGAIDHTLTYSNSVNLSNADYCTYDPEVFPNVLYYPTPSESIPSENYLKACFVGMGNAWAVSIVSPGLFIFTVEDNDPLAWGQDLANRYYFPGKEDIAVYGCVKIPNENILDAVEVFSAEDIADSKPRFSPSLDAGYIAMTNKQGYTIYRNVDQAATEAIEDNAGKIVYGYTGGTTGIDDVASTDPSTIDAEASIRNGAHIVYKDTNNSTYDFHQRNKASIRE